MGKTSGVVIHQENSFTWHPRVLDNPLKKIIAEECSVYTTKMLELSMFRPPNPSLQNEVRAPGIGWIRPADVLLKRCLFVKASGGTLQSQWNVLPDRKEAL